MSRTGRALAVATVALGVALTSTACGGGGDSEPIGQPSSSAPETTSEPAETSTSSPATTSSRATTTSSSSAGASSTDDGVLDEEDEGRELGLEDFFNADSQWEERRYDLAAQQDVPGVGSIVQGCGQSSTYDRTLELRLGNNFSELTFSAAQANNSQRSDQNMVVEILANNEQRDIRSVPFNQTQDFTIDVTGVNALVLRLYLDDEVADCRGSVVGVISEATVN
ncbi:hypothetical protein [Blastococcus sp. SYSU D00813]